jgi:hypothetical protein
MRGLLLLLQAFALTQQAFKLIKRCIEQFDTLPF